MRSFTKRRFVAMMAAQYGTRLRRFLSVRLKNERLEEILGRLPPRVGAARVLHRVGDLIFDDGVRYDTWTSNVHHSRGLIPPRALQV